MRETPEEIEKRLAERATLAIPPDVLEHPMPFPSRLEYAAKIIKRTIPIRLYEEVRQASLALTLPLWSCCPGGNHSPAERSCIPGRRLLKALEELEKAIGKP